MHCSWWSWRSVVRVYFHSLWNRSLYPFHIVPGFLSPRPPPLNTLPSTFSNALQMFENLSSLTLTPSTYHEDIFTESLTVLKNSVHLTKLAVNSSCMSETTAPLLTEISGIRKLTLYGPGRTMLNLLPDWLGRLSKTLTGLHFKVSCTAFSEKHGSSYVCHTG
jgi:hypothetical protein